MSATAHATDDTAVRFAVAITITIGGGALPAAGGAFDVLLQRADRARYRRRSDLKQF